MNDNFGEINFKKNLDRLIRARNLDIKYCEQDRTHFYFIINRHLGDSIWVLRLLKAIKEYYSPNGDRYHRIANDSLRSLYKKNEIINKISIMTTESIVNVAKLYSDDIDSIIVLNREELADMELYALSKCSPYQNFIYDEDVFMRVFPNEACNDEGTRNRNAMFKVNNLMWQLCVPSNLPRTSMKLSDETESETRLLMLKNSYDLNKLVVICPFAYSLSTLDKNIWIKLTSLLQKAGYKVLTNTAGAEEAIYTTEKLNVPVDVLACMAVKGCRVIGVQSGLMDILAQMSPPKLIVLNIIRNDVDRRYANGTRTVNEVNTVNGVTRLRIEHFEEDYVLKLLMDNFH